MSDRKWPNLMGAAASAVDRAFLAAIRAQSRESRARVDAEPVAERIARLDEATALYSGSRARELIEEPARFFPEPPAIEPSTRVVRPHVWDVAWPSTSEPFAAEVAERWLAPVENRTARARVYLHSSPDTVTSRPALICIHGYMGGHWFLEEAGWPTDTLLRRGIDVALPLLPLHAARSAPHRGGPGFPSGDPRLTNEGFRQAVSDIRALAAWLRARGAPHVGAMGMSLGGYTAALLATIPGAVDFVVPMIPLASLSDFAREQGRLGDGPDAEALHAAIERAHAVVSPLARPLTLSKDRALVIAASHDRITPIGHARRIADHFGCEVVTLSGGHLVQLGRDAAFRGLVDLLERERILAR